MAKTITDCLCWWKIPIPAMTRISTDTLVYSSLLYNIFYPYCCSYLQHSSSQLAAECCLLWLDVPVVAVTPSLPLPCCCALLDADAVLWLSKSLNNINPLCHICNIYAYWQPRLNSHVLNKLRPRGSCYICLSLKTHSWVYSLLQKHKPATETFKFTFRLPNKGLLSEWSNI